jgi:acyl carrier protein
MGFDSLMSIELKNQIEIDLGVTIAMAKLIQGPTLIEVTDWVTEQLSAVETVGVAVTIPSSEFEEGVL